MSQLKINRRGEKGNVLFLILIAVALFAALSYAVTQSTRGGGSSDSETNLINSAQATQYPAGVRTATVRMILNGISISDLEFNPPSSFSSCTSPKLCVFHPSGGGATYASAPGDLMASTSAGTWRFNGEFEIVDVGISSSGASAGNEILALLPGVTKSLCDRVNEELGIAGDIVTSSDAAADYNVDMDNTYSMPAAEFVLGDSNTLALKGQPFGCFQNQASGPYVYYHVLVEQ
jgi:hypothetical protein